MSFGTLFLDPSTRLNPDIEKVYAQLREEEIRKNIKIPDPKKNKLTQELGKLYHIGVEDSNVKDGLKNRLQTKKNKSKEKQDYSLVSLYSDETSSKARSKHIFPKKPKPFLPISQTIYEDNKAKGHKFEVPDIPNVYEVKIQAMPASSAYNANTPGMWPAEIMSGSTSKNAYIPYDSTLTMLPTDNQTLKKRIFHQSGTLPSSPLISSRPCSKSVPKHIHKHTHNLIEPQDSNITSTATSSSSLMSQPSNLSALQQTLVECGRLKLTESLHQQKETKQLQASIQHHKQQMNDHIRWLQSSFSDQDAWHYHPTNNSVASSLTLPSNHSPISSKSPGNKSIKSDIDSIATSHSSISHSVGDSWIGFSKFSKSKPLRSIDDQSTPSIGNLKIQTSDNTSNPFRARHSQTIPTKHIRYARSLPKLSSQSTDPMRYKDEIFMKSTNNFQICIQPSVDIHHIPSKKEVNQAIITLTKKSIFHYHARIIECGALIRALKDIKHSTPGFQAIIELHRLFIQAASINITPFILSKQQLFHIISQQVPWLSQDSIGRLLLSFDITNTGLIKYIKLTCTLLTCFEPAMINLASALDRNRKNYQQYIFTQEDVVKETKAFLERTSSTQGRGGKGGEGGKSLNQQQKEQHHQERIIEIFKTKKLSEEEWKDFRGEMLIIRFLHRLYAQCYGFTTEETNETNNSEDKQPTIRLEDLKEMFSCCVNSTQDEQQIETVLFPMLTYLYQQITTSFSLKTNPQAKKYIVDVNGMLDDHYGMEDIHETLPLNVDINKITQFKQLYQLLHQKPIMIKIDQLIDALFRHPNVLREFIRQVRLFRLATKPYIMDGSHSIDDAISHYSDSQQ